MQTKRFNNRAELIMIAFSTGILLILFVPIPAGLLDLLLIMNFSWTLTILLLAFYTDKPLSFSTFPALLLISTLFRLSLNVSATRLILSDGSAGRVISAVGQYVIHDNYIMGLVVFLILIIVQYVVVTTGAQRVAEVAARFTLDSMPGKQMSIDADLNMGLISQSDAKERRSQIEREANFYGAMDGASKFVKGDAIAGVLIILVDLIGGFAIGMAERGLSFSESIHTYSLLTVGDGLVTQIPALTVSMATGIIVTRAASDAQLGSEVARQVTAYPKSLILVCFCLLGLLGLKGIPIWPVLTVFSFFAFAAWYAFTTGQEQPLEPFDESLYEKIKIHPIEIQLNTELFKELARHEASLFQRFQQLRERIAYDFGFVIPEVKLRADSKLSYPHYQLCIQGHAQGVHPLYLDKLLAMNANSFNDEGKASTAPLAFEAIEGREPSYGLPALWINPDDEPLANKAGFTTSNALSVLTTHLGELVQNHLALLLTRSETEALLGQESIKALRDELIPGLLALGQVQRILHNLLQENVSIRHLPTIMDVLLEHSKMVSDPQQLTELVRSRLTGFICQKLVVNQNRLPVLLLDTSLEQQMSQGLTHNVLALEPALTDRFIVSLAKQVENMINERMKPILLCSSLLRRQVKQLTQRVFPHLTVLGMNEIPVTIQVESFGVVK